ncbi:MAG TPA: four helix bundle protein [Terriglobales bacterium]|nr:four helix bundle protein [Terriglobales bacterium]
MFAIRIVRLCRKLPATPEAKIISSQLLRSGTSVAANYRAVCRARSKAEFASKMGIVIEEADETAFWMELLLNLDYFPEGQLRNLLSEANQLVAIFVSSRRTVLVNREAESRVGDQKVS